MDLLARFNLPKEIQAFEILIKCCKLVPLLGGKMSFADFLESLTAFEAGGSELAYAPTKNLRVLPADASTIGGSSAAVDWFRNSMEHSNNAMLFLVGAPGNGKSYLLKKNYRRIESDWRSLKGSPAFRFSGSGETRTYRGQ